MVSPWKRARISNGLLIQSQTTLVVQRNATWIQKQFMSTPIKVSFPSA